MRSTAPAAGRSPSTSEVPFDLAVVVLLRGGVSHVDGSPGSSRPTPTTLQSIVRPNTFVIGDAAAIPTSKAGSDTPFEGAVLTGNIARFLRGEQLDAGHTTRFIESGFGKALLLDFNYDTEPGTSRQWYPSPTAEEENDMPTRHTPAPRSTMPTGSSPTPASGVRTWHRRSPGGRHRRADRRAWQVVTFHAHQSPRTAPEPRSGCWGKVPGRVYPELIMANGARAEANLLFTFFGLDAIQDIARAHQARHQWRRTGIGLALGLP